MRTKDDIKKIGFTAKSIYIETQDGVKKSLAFKYFPRLQQATPKQRANYTLSAFGIHWEELNEDLSFEGFFTFEPKAQPKRLWSC